MRVKTAAFFVLLLFGFVGRLPAQEITGTISGTVSDSSGAAVPQASVTITHLGTGATRQAETSEAGVFFFNSLPIGS